MAALARLRLRVEQLERHRRGIDPATMPLPRHGNHRFGDRLGTPGADVDAVTLSEAGPSEAGLAEAAVDAGFKPLIDATIHVAVLGPVCVHHLGRLTPQQQALVCFLALRGGSSRDTIIEALWGGRAISDSRFLNLITETRAVVGACRLPPADGGRYSLEGVTIDSELLMEAAQLAGQARRADDRQGESRWLRRGLSLIAGPLLRPPGRRYWTWLDDAYDVVACLESSIVAQAIRLADLALAAGDGHGDVETAEWAYRRCLVAVPHNHEVAGSLAMLYRRTDRRSAAASLERNRLSHH